MSPMTMKAARRHHRATAIAAVIVTTITTMRKALPRRQLTGYSRLTDDEAMPSP